MEIGLRRHFYRLTEIIKNWIIGWSISRALIGFAIMVYEPLYHALQIWLLYASAQNKSKLKVYCFYI